MKLTIQYSSIKIPSPARLVLSKQPRALVGISCPFSFPITHHLTCGSSIYRGAVCCCVHWCAAPESRKSKNPSLFCFQKRDVFTVSVILTFYNSIKAALQLWSYLKVKSKSILSPKGKSYSVPQVCVMILHSSFLFMFLNEDGRLLIAGVEATCCCLPFLDVGKTCLLAWRACWIPIFWERKKMTRNVWWWSDNYLGQLWGIQALFKACWRSWKAITDCFSLWSLSWF